MPKDGSSSWKHSYIGRLLVAALLAAGVLLLIVALTLRMAADMVERNLDAQAEQAGEMVKDLVGASLRRMVAQVTAASKEPAVRAVARSDAPDRQALAALQDELRTLRVQNPDVSLAFYIDDTGTAVAIDEPMPHLIGENFGYRDYFRGTMESNAPYVSEAFISTSGTKVATVSIPVTADGRSQRPDGIVAVSWQTGQQLQQLVEQVAEEHGVNVSVIDQRGHVVSAVGADPVSLPEVPGFEPVDEPEIRSRDGQRVTALVPLDDSGWTIRADVPTEASWANYAQLRRTLLALATVLAVLVGVVLWILMRTARQREQARARVREGEARLRGVLQAASDAYLSIDPAGRIRDWNARAEELFGWEAGEIVGVSAVDTLFDERDRASTAEGIGRRWAAELAGTVDSAPHEVTLRHRDGTPVPVEISVWVVGDGDEATLNAFARDIRARRRHEDELAAARDAAVAAAEAKGSFLARMSHELRTPLNGVLGMAQLLDTPELSATQRVQLATLQASGRQLLDLIGDVLDLSKLDAGNLALEEQPIDMEEVASAALANAAVPAAERGLRLSVDVDDRVPTRVLGDRHRVQQILDNLVTNAVKFTASGSGGGAVAPPPDAGPDMLRVSVSDTGIGIPAEMLEPIFTPFTQADTSTTRRYGGTGLGLPIVADLAARMGGEVGVDSEPGVGSTFRVTLQLPAVEATDGPGGATGPADDSAPAGARVLLVEDNFVNQEVAAGLLESLGHRVTRADDGKAAIDAVSSGSFDVVLMDCQMPVMSGFEATRHIRQMPGPVSDLPIIALTASATTEERDRCLEAGMDDHLAKPVTRERLEEVVRRYAPGRAAAGS